MTRSAFQKIAEKAKKEKKTLPFLNHQNLVCTVLCCETKHKVL